MKKNKGKSVEFKFVDEIVKVLVLGFMWAGVIATGEYVGWALFITFLAL